MNEDTRMYCANQLCKSAGYLSGYHISNTDCMQSSSAQAAHTWYWQANKQTLVFGQVNLLVRMKAMCRNTGATVKIHLLS